MLDFTQVVAGPYATMVLADLGADVIKVERIPAGDHSRRSLQSNGLPMNFFILNRNKRSVALDLARPEGLAVALELARGADVVIENLRPGAMKKMGLGPEEIRQLNPSAIYCSISGFGATGPDRMHAGFDIVAQAMSGLMTVTGHGDDGRLAKVSPPVADFLAAMNALVGILASLYARRTDGAGEFVDVSLLDSTLALMIPEAAEAWSTRMAPRPTGHSNRYLAPYQAFRASDGWFVIAAGNDSLWKRLCHELARDDLLSDPRFVTMLKRVANVDALTAELGPIFERHPVVHWLDRLRLIGCPVAPVLDVKAAFEGEQARRRDMTVEMEYRGVGRVKGIGSPLKLTNRPVQVYLPPPVLGEHTREVLEAVCGLDAATIDRLARDGVIVCGDAATGATAGMETRT